MSAGLYNITIEQGADYGISLALTNDNGTIVNLTGANVLSQIRSQSDNSIIGTFVSSINTGTGTITLSLSGATSSTFLTGNHIYDILVTFSSGVRQRILEGYCTIDPEVTQIPA
jgi:hypothetical protein